MPQDQPATVGEALAAPLGDVIAHVGRGIAEAQAALDAQTFRTFKRQFDASDDVAIEMRRLGFTPTWYRIPEAEAEVSMSISIGARGPLPTGSTGAARQTPGTNPEAIQLYAAPIDAAYASKYEFHSEGVSRLKFKIVAVPPSQEADATRVVPKGLIRERPNQLSFDEARRLLDDWQIEYELTGRKATHPGGQKVVSVQPEPGTLLKPGQKVTLTLD